MQKENSKITVIGASVIDILARPVDLSAINIGSQPMEDIVMSFGGDALNEAVILKRLGADVELVSKVGNDSAGKEILDFIVGEGISDKSIIKSINDPTSINIVLVDDKGERYFLTNPSGCLRKLSEADLLPYLGQAGDIVSFASIFVSNELDIEATTRVFKKIKEKNGRILAVDMTKAKHGETLADISPMLKYVDLIFPNEAEIALLTGENDRYKNASYLVEAGVKCAVIKCGQDGCLIYDGREYIEVPAYENAKVVDSTGAGDSFVAGFLYALSCGYELKDCGKLANAVASCTVEAVGASEGISSIAKPYERYLKMA